MSVFVSLSGHFLTVEFSVLGVESRVYESSRVDVLRSS